MEEVEQLATCSIGSTTEFSVNQITVGNQGQGYTDEPIVTISGPVGSGVTAIGIASITSDGKLNSVNLIKPGVGYTVAPTVSIAGFSTVGFGTFVYNETVTGQSSGVTARVRDFRTTTSPFPGTPPSTDLRVSLNTGEFYTGEVIVGSISSAIDMLLITTTLKVMITLMTQMKKLKQKQTIY